MASLSLGYSPISLGIGCRGLVSSSSLRIGDTLTARIEVIELIPEENRAGFKTTCRNQKGQELVIGTAWVMPPGKGENGR